MTTPPENDEAPAEKPGPLQPQGHFAGVPYDFRRPSKARVKARAWNPDDSRLFPPRSIGVGWGVNFHWVLHPREYLKGRR